MHILQDIREIEGLFPHFDNKNIVEVNYLIDGSNFAFTASSIKSYWGGTVIGTKPSDIVPTTVFAKYLFNKSYLFTNLGVYVLEEGVYELALMLPFTIDLYGNYDWSVAHVDNKWLISHPNLDRKLYVITETSVDYMDISDLSFDTPVLGITQCLNRLIVMCQDTISWSAIDEPFILEPSYGRSVGYQSLVLSRGTTPYRVLNHGLGFLVFTDTGIIEVSPTQEQSIVFNFKFLTDLSPVNPKAISANKVFITKLGLYKVNLDNTVVKFAQEFNETITDCRFMRSFMDLLFISVEEDLCYIYQEQYQKWCSFNSIHYDITELANNTLGYADLNTVYEFNNAPETSSLRISCARISPNMVGLLNKADSMVGIEQVHYTNKLNTSVNLKVVSSMDGKLLNKVSDTYLILTEGVSTLKAVSALGHYHSLLFESTVPYDIQNIKLTINFTNMRY